MRVLLQSVDGDVGSGSGDGGGAVECLDNQQRTPLMLAVCNGHVDVAHMLISEFSSNVQATDCDHRTALHRAVSSCDV